MSPDHAVSRVLFPALDEASVASLDGYEKVLDRTAPLKPKHRRMLPGAIKSLSSTLTGERDKLKSDYLSAPGPLNAYLRYFLPWNLVRLTRLFSGLGPETGLGLKSGSVVVDLGSGPLTAVQALWLAAPKLREVPLTFICVDRAPQAMRRGLALFNTLSGGDRPEAGPWKIKLVNGSLTERISGGADLVICANALNEFVRQTRKPEPVQAGFLAGTLAQRLRPGGRLLCVEPGVRNASRLLTLLRDRLMENALSIHAPCPHSGECPMPGEAGTPWCHFPFSVHDAPGWLKKLSEEAGLSKVRASLSFILAGKDEQDLPADAVRIVSDEFPVPSRNASARYGCSGRGLTLVTMPRFGGPRLTPGQLLSPKWPESTEKDDKSGAVILPLGAAGPAPRKVPAPRASEDRKQPEKDSRSPGRPARRSSGKDGPTRRGKPTDRMKPRGGRKK